jgi:hypothetical protein
VRIALDASGTAGSRAARVLLAERAVGALGLIGRRSTTRDPRIHTVTNLAGWDVLVSDHADQYAKRYRQASDHGIPLVVAGTQKRLDEQPDIPLVVGANRSAGLAACLAAVDCARRGNPLEVVIGWTKTGQPLRRGAALAFPQPVGNRWALEEESVWPDAPSGVTYLAAPIEGPWAGVTAKVTTASKDGVEVRTMGVADDAHYLDGIALGAAALVAGTGAFPVGLHYPTAAAGDFLDAALRAGLEVATFVEHTRK